MRPDLSKVESFVRKSGPPESMIVFDIKNDLVERLLVPRSYSEALFAVQVFFDAEETIQIIKNLFESAEVSLKPTKEDVETIKYILMS